MDDEMKQCPFCAEMIKSTAVVCRYCKSNLAFVAKEQKGRFVKVCLKARDKTYFGEIFVPSHISRLSNVINDQRQFIALTNTREETATTEIKIGFLAINKSAVEWIRLLEREKETAKDGHTTRSLD